MSVAAQTARFRRLVAIVVTALVALVAVVLGIGAVQGPRLDDAVVDAEGAVTTSGTQLRLVANQPLAPVSAEQVAIEPAADVEVATQGDVVALRFGHRLLAGTEYRVTVDGVQSAGGGAASRFEFAFETGQPVLHHLERGEGDDVVVASRIGTAEREAVFAAPRIQEFAVVGALIAAITLDDDDGGAASLELASRDGGPIERVPLPVEAGLEQLRASDTGSVLGFLATSPGSRLPTLYRLDLEAGRDAVAVTGFDGAPLGVLEWEFVPGTTDVLAQLDDGSTVRVDESGTPLPVGAYVRLGPVSGDGTRVAVADAFGQIALTLATGEEQRLVPAPIDGVEPFAGDAATLADGRWVQKVAAPRGDGTFRSLLTLEDGAGSRVLFEPPADGGSIESFSVSPNEQYVALETVPDVAAAEPDGYPAEGRATSTSTIIVDIERGTVVKSVEGVLLRW